MNEKSIGSFLSALRKANGYTQQQVADILCVSNKTISKWERGDGYPEITMLPAIAELYSVTVDEILKGERITENSLEKDTEKKTEERTKLIIEKTELRFKNYCMVALALGVLSTILSPIISNSLYEPVSVFALVFVFLMTVASVITAFIARNNYLSALKFNETAVVYNAKAKTNIIIAFEAVFAITVLVTGLSGFNYSTSPFGYWCITLIITSAVALIICLALNSKLDSENNPKIQQLRKKILNTSLVVISVIIALNAIAPFAICVVDAISVSTSYVFTDGVGYDYETQDGAINDYYVFKSYFTDGKQVMQINDYSTENGDYYVSGENIVCYTTGTEKGYKIDLVEYSQLTEYFNSKDEVESYIKNNTISVDVSEFLRDGCQITFDDKTHSVTYAPISLYRIFEYVTDILPIFALIASISSLCVFIADAIIYGAKKKKLK